MQDRPLDLAALMRRAERVFGHMRIVSATEWISSVALENEIMSHPAVHGAAVIGVADEQWRERLLACVVPVAGQELDEEDLRWHLARRVAGWWIPERVLILDEIPKTSTGTFSKTTLRELVRARGVTSES